MPESGIAQLMTEGKEHLYSLLLVGPIAYEDFPSDAGLLIGLDALCWGLSYGLEASGERRRTFDCRRVQPSRHLSRASISILSHTMLIQHHDHNGRRLQ